MEGIRHARRLLDERPCAGWAGPGSCSPRQGLTSARPQGEMEAELAALDDEEAGRLERLLEEDVDALNAAACGRGPPGATEPRFGEGRD